MDSVLSGDLLIDDLTLPIESKSFDSFEENTISIRGEAYVKFKATFTVDYSIAIRDLCVFCRSSTLKWHVNNSSFRGPDSFSQRQFLKRL